MNWNAFKVFRDVEFDASVADPYIQLPMIGSHRARHYIDLPARGANDN